MSREKPATRPANAALRSVIERPNVNLVLRILNDSGEEARLVGGVVRNCLLGLAASDIDIATTALPGTVMERAKANSIHAVPTGIEHGTVTLVIDGIPHEVTTLREDIATDGRHATVKFGRSFRTDALRRDFTINALSADMAATVFDYANGIGDLEAGQVRFIGDPNQRIGEDLLRVFRFFRFSAFYAEGRLDPEGLRAATHDIRRLERLSRERIRTEIMKLLAAPFAPPVVAAMAESGILSIALAGDYDIEAFNALCRVETALGLPASPLRRLIALTARNDNDIERLRTALRLTNREADHMRALLETGGAFKADKPADFSSQKAARVLLYRLGAENYRDALVLHAARTGQNMADILALPQKWTPPRFIPTGKDVLALGIARGPEISRILKSAEQAWLAADMPDDAATQHRILCQVATSKAV